MRTRLKQGQAQVWRCSFGGLNHKIVAEPFDNKRQSNLQSKLQFTRLKANRSVNGYLKVKMEARMHSMWQTVL